MLLKTHHLEENACDLYPAKRSPMCCFIGGKTVHKKWKHLLNSSHIELKKMNASQWGDPDASHNKKRSLIEGDFYCYFLGNGKEMEGKQNLTSSLGFRTTSQYQSKTSC